MSCSRNDVVLLPIPFTDLTSRKVRPAIVIGRSGTDLFLVPISSQLSNTDFALKDWRASGLNRIHAVGLGSAPPRVRCWAPSPNTRHLEGRRTVWNVALRSIRPARVPVGTRGARGLPDFNCIVPAKCPLWCQGPDRHGRREAGDQDSWCPHGG